MSIRNIITITGTTPKARAWIDRKNLSKLPDFTGYDDPHWDRFDENLDCTRITGEWSTKHETDGVGEWAARVTRKHPGIRVEWEQDWDNHDADEAGRTIDTWIHGDWEKATARTGGLIPVNLADLLAAVRATAADHEAAALADSADDEHAAAIALRDAALALAEALDGAAA